MARSGNATIFHDPRFLKYHGKKFKQQERYFCWEDNAGEIIAAFPYCIFTEEGHRVARSPYGASYGGLAYISGLSFSSLEQITNQLMEEFRVRKVTRVILTLVPSIYQKKPDDTFAFLLLKNKGKIIFSELTAVVQLRDVAISAMAAKAIRKGIQAGVVVEKNNDLETFYRILLDNRAKFKTKPTHTKQELAWLIKKMPGCFHIFTASQGKKAIASALVFSCNSQAALVFYWAHLEAFSHLRPVNVLVNALIAWAKESGLNYLDYGTQTFRMQYTQGHIAFKESMGSSPVFRTTYELDL